LNPITRYLPVILLLVAPVVVVSGQFQPAEVKKSNEKAVIQGKYYYIHTVQKGQTFFSICKAYGVNQEIVIRENPGINPSDLSEGQAVRIPDILQTPPVVSSEDRKQEDKRFYYHTVKPGQTVYFLSRKYNIPEEWIYQFNPRTRESVSAGQVIIIPKRKDFEQLLASEDTSKYWYYVVRDKDTLYSLSREYGVSVAKIIDENPELQQGLRTGITIRIPKTEPSDTLSQVTDSTMEYSLTEPDCETRWTERGEYKIALMLPFFSSVNAEEPVENAPAGNDEVPEDPVRRQQELIGRSFIEFYEGFLLSLDTLRQTGLSVKLYVYDTERDTIKIKKIIQEMYIVQPDLIIGPAYTEEVRLVSQFARIQNILMVSPLSTRGELIAENASIIQVVPSEDEENAFFARYISHYKNSNIILFRGADSLSLKETWKFKKELLSYLNTDSLGNPLNFKDYKLNDSTMRKLSNILAQNEENIIVIASKNEPDVTALIGKLYLHSRVYKLTLFGDPSWQVWKSVDINYFHIMQMQYYTPFYVDYSNPEVIRFVKKCRRVFGFEPYEITPKGYNFCMLGYDIGLYFISALDRYGKSFAPCMNKLDLNFLLTRYNYLKIGEGGYLNKTINMVRYKTDYTMEMTEDNGPDETLSE
jgi:LysM repeat protein/ABC-type branched-subunit amino acid transport system substrate-binding protein